MNDFFFFFLKRGSKGKSERKIRVALGVTSAQAKKRDLREIINIFTFIKVYFITKSTRK